MARDDKPWLAFRPHHIESNGIKLRAGRCTTAYGDLIEMEALYAKERQ